jgi:hypothetical protein
MEESLSSSRLMGRCSSEPLPDGRLMMQIFEVAQCAADVQRYLVSGLRWSFPNELDMA